VDNVFRVYIVQDDTRVDDGKLRPGKAKTVVETTGASQVSTSLMRRLFRLHSQAARMTGETSVGCL
jgi:hypothetical protein